jgi:Flp pilus assembly protein TadB
MKHLTVFLSYSVMLLALLAVNPAIQAAPRKAHPAQKAAKTAVATHQEDFQKHVEQEIANLKDDVYTRATWKKLQEVKQEADDNASSMKLAMFCSAAAGLIVGCVVTFFVARRKPEDDLKIT